MGSWSTPRSKAARRRFAVTASLLIHARQEFELAGQRPYTAVKHKMAEETREERLCMARRAQGERQKQELC